MEAQCKEVYYESGSYNLVQGREAQYLPARSIESGMAGWGVRSERSKLVLVASIGGKEFEIWIDRFFKNKIGSLTKKRRAIIEKTMPQTIRVSEATSPRGTRYYVADEADLCVWFDRCLAVDPKSIGRKASLEEFGKLIESLMPQRP